LEKSVCKSDEPFAELTSIRRSCGQVWQPMKMAPINNASVVKVGGPIQTAQHDVTLSVVQPSRCISFSNDCCTPRSNVAVVATIQTVSDLSNSITADQLVTPRPKVKPQMADVDLLPKCAACGLARLHLIANLFVYRILTTELLCRSICYNMQLLINICTYTHIYIHTYYSHSYVSYNFLCYYIMHTPT
jgi:hypothetical protein